MLTIAIDNTLLVHFSRLSRLRKTCEIKKLRKKVIVKINDAKFITHYKTILITLTPGYMIKVGPLSSPPPTHATQKRCVVNADL